QSSPAATHPVSLWDLETGRLRERLLLPEQSAGPVAFSADGKHFAAASQRPGTRVRLWETATGKEVRVIEGVRGAVRSLAFLPDGRRLVSGMDDGTALVWHLTDKPPSQGPP